MFFLKSAFAFAKAWPRSTAPVAVAKQKADSEGVSVVFFRGGGVLQNLANPPTENALRS